MDYLYNILVKLTYSINTQYKYFIVKSNILLIHAKDIFLGHRAKCFCIHSVKC